jgi:biopolymer transport protein ExbB
VFIFEQSVFGNGQLADGQSRKQREKAAMQAWPGLCYVQGMNKNLPLALIATLVLHNFAHAADINIVEQAAEGGAAIVVTLGLSILFLAVSIERLMHFRARSIMPDGLVERVKPLWAAQDFTRLQQLLAEDDSTLARVIAYMVAHRQHGYAVVNSGAGDIASMELRHHQQKAYALAIVATVAPIVGLLGTVVGMIDAFHVIAFSEGMGNPALLAGGISKALINTAAGLCVALPALGMHHFLKNRQAFFGLTLERKINSLINEWFLHGDAAPQNLHVVSHAH